MSLCQILVYINSEVDSHITYKYKLYAMTRNYHLHFLADIDNSLYYGSLIYLKFKISAFPGSLKCKLSDATKIRNFG